MKSVFTAFTPFLRSTDLAVHWTAHWLPVDLVALDPLVGHY